MGTFDFWQRWLVVVCIVFSGIGLLVATLNALPVFGPWNDGFDTVFAESERLGAEAQAVKSFLLGPLGGTILGFFVLSGFVAAGPFKRREPWAWWALATSLVSWFVLDSAVSIAHGAWFNVVLINCVTLLAEGLPLLMTYRAFLNRGAVLSP
ncbi:hypothetical protein MK489_23390 [Myxococcota bacterium]|nr:hypothetical protein [Myxococcota bacterium]